MGEHELAERFEESRGHLRAVAYRMLGSLSEADDAVQEAWLRFSRSGTTGVADRRGKIGQDPQTVSHDDRMDDQAIFVDRAGSHQRSGEADAARELGPGAVARRTAFRVAYCGGSAEDEGAGDDAGGSRARGLGVGIRAAVRDGARGLGRILKVEHPAHGDAIRGLVTAAMRASAAALDPRGGSA